VRLLVVGHGRMGRLVAALAPAHGFEVAAVLDREANPGGAGIARGGFDPVDVAVEFTTPEAVVANVARLAERGIPAVVGTTGWKDREADLREVVERAGIGVVVAANFSLGAWVLEAAATAAAGLLSGRAEYGAWLHEQHHAAKRDAPSGTALALLEALRRAGYTQAVDVSHTRAGSNPGTHTIGFDGPAESLAFTHAVRDRAAFAHGALAAARWVVGRRGWFTMRDVLGLPGPPAPPAPPA
jgi:4-hydroxy-tetrahydrodipicolinate reductase